MFLTGWHVLVSLALLVGKVGVGGWRFEYPTRTFTTALEYEELGLHCTVQNIMIPYSPDIAVAMQTEFIGIYPIGPANQYYKQLPHASRSVQGAP